MISAKTETKENNFKKRFLNLKFFNRLLLALIIVTGVYYLTSINDLTVKGFKLQELKEQKTKLANQNSEYELDTMTLSSYSSINSRVADLKMVAVGKIDYLSSSASIVARK